MPKQVEAKIVKGIILLTVRYGEEFLFTADAHNQLSSELTQSYREILEKEKGKTKTNSCIIKIQSANAGSFLVRAIFDLWKEVTTQKNGQGGQVICVDYPSDYIDSLTSLGLPTLPGFSLAATEDEAIQKLISIK